MAVEKIGPFMQARDVAVPRGYVTKRWAIHNGNVPDGDVGDMIAAVDWYAPWRRYVLRPIDGAIFDASCLVAIELFLRKQTAAHVAERSA